MLFMPPLDSFKEALPPLELNRVPQKPRDVTFDPSELPPVAPEDAGAPEGVLTGDCRPMVSPLEWGA